MPRLRWYLLIPKAGCLTRQKGTWYYHPGHESQHLIAQSIESCCACEAIKIPFRFQFTEGQPKNGELHTILSRQKLVLVLERLCVVAVVHTS